MNQAQNHVVELIRVPDDQFPALSDGALKALSAKLAPRDAEVDSGAVPPVLAISVPRVADVEKLERIPVLFAKRWSGQRSWEVDLDQNMNWIMTDLRTGEVRVVCPLTLDKRRMVTPAPSRTPPPPDDFDARTITYGVERLHLPAIFGPGFPSTRYAVTMAIHDWISNTVVFERKPALPPSPTPVRTATPYVEAVAAALPAGSQSLIASIPAGSSVVRVIASVPREQAALVKSGATPPAPIMPVGLVFLKLDSTTPKVVELMVPASLQPRTVDTRFSVDLRTAAQGIGLSGEVLLYVVTGQLITGPHPIKL